VALLAVLAPPRHNVWLVVLIVWVAVYNSVVTLGLNRVENDSVQIVVRSAAVIDGASLLALLAIYLPSPPAVLIAIFPCVLIEMVTFDGAVGGIYGVAMFVVGLVTVRLLGANLNWTDLVLWSAVIAVTATSMTFSSQLMLRSNGSVGVAASIEAPRRSAPRLTAREQEVLRLVAQGYSNAMIASRLNLSENTVKGHVETLLTRFNARNRAEAVAAAGRLELL
jgi:DNA-binding CsgD family transcriptional regulator